MQSGNGSSDRLRHIFNFKRPIVEAYYLRNYRGWYYEQHDYRCYSLFDITVLPFAFILPLGKTLVQTENKYVYKSILCVCVCKKQCQESKDYIFIDRTPQSINFFNNQLFHVSKHLVYEIDKFNADGKILTTSVSNFFYNFWAQNCVYRPTTVFFLYEGGRTFRFV